MRRPLWLAGFSLFLGACFQDTTPQHSDYLPLDYQTKFQIVRGCRAVADHESTYLRVLADPLAADPYITAAYPLPAGSVVVGEEHGDPGCGSLSGYYVMAKQQPGYYSAGGDWRWQRLDNNQRIQQDGKLDSCALCHAKKCAPTDYLCSLP
jgi:hypothetical protein